MTASTASTGKSRDLILALGASLLCMVLFWGCKDFKRDESSSNNYNQSPILGCTDCHGNEETGNPAPPRDTQGRTSTSEVTVGAHQSHLGPSDWRSGISCEECHRVPTAVNDPGHIDGGPAELTWGSLATSGDASPVWDRVAATCDGVYCHGGTLGPGGSNTSPSWTQVDGSQAACGTCHGLPPAPPHPQGTACADCHGEVVDASGNFVNPDLHINGRVEVEYTGCRGCHGNEDNAAPPVDTLGRSDTSLVTVGAHQSHLVSAPWRRAVVCNDCHIVPTSIDDPGHIDGSPAEVTFGALAQVGGANPVFDRVATTCSGTYCHGTTLLGPDPGGSVDRTPLWTVVDGTYSECGTTCHTLPPGGGHPQNQQCQQCHGSVISAFDSVSPASSTWTNPSLHVNGVVNF